MVLNILLNDSTPTPLFDIWGGGRLKVKIRLFQNMAMLQIKLKGMTHAATWWQQIVCSQNLPQPLPPVKI